MTGGAAGPTVGRGVGLTVRLEALDPLLFGDNRPARAGEDHAQEDQDPSPLTLFGAVGARIAAAHGLTDPREYRRRWEEEVAAVLGPFRKRPGAPDRDAFTLRGFTLADASGEPWFPAPLHLRFEAGPSGPVAHDLLAPEPLEDGVASSAGAPWRLAAPGKPHGREPEPEAPGPHWVDRYLLEKALTGGGTREGLGELPSLDEISQGSDRLYRPEGRVGLAIANARGTAVPGRLFSRPYRRFAGAVGGGSTRAGYSPWQAAGYTAWVSVRSLPEGAPQRYGGVGFLGGDRGRVALRFVREEPLAPLLQAVRNAVEGSDGFLLLLLTPARVEGAGEERGDFWPEIEGCRPLTHATGRGRWVSGWNRAAHRPRESRVLAPEGSVAFYPWPAGRPTVEARRQLVAERWLEAIAEPFSNEGFGRALVGVWRREGAGASHG